MSYPYAVPGDSSNDNTKTATTNRTTKKMIHVFRKFVALKQVFCKIHVYIGPARIKGLAETSVNAAADAMTLRRVWLINRKTLFSSFSCVSKYFPCSRALATKYQPIQLSLSRFQICSRNVKQTQFDKSDWVGVVGIQ
jgi:hypothetical protein